MPEQYIEKEGIEFLRELVRTPSLSGALSAVADVVEGKMNALDFDAVWRDEAGNVIARKQGHAPGARLLFDAHMDVVQTGSPERWHHPPFGAELSGGRLWGRGATDTKASLAGMVVALGRLPRESFRGTLYVTGSLEEETLEGAALAGVLDAVQPDGVVVGEPTDCRLAIGHKGRCRLVFTFTGRSGHTSSPEKGENAIRKMALAARRIEEIPLPSDPLLGNGVMEPIIVTSSPNPNASTIPDVCQIIYDRRLVRGETREVLLAAYRQALADLPGWSVAYEELEIGSYTGWACRAPDFHPAWAADPDSEWVRLALAGLEQAGLPPVTYTAPYCTNAAVSAGERGIPSLVFGPSSIALAHIEDEYIELDELRRGMRGFVGLAHSLGQFGGSRAA